MQCASESADKVGVEQCDDATNARNAKPDCHVFRSVWHHESDDVTLADGVSLRPACIAARTIAQRAIAERLAIRQQRRRVTIVSACSSMTCARMRVGWAVICLVSASARSHALLAEPLVSGAVGPLPGV